MENYIDFTPLFRPDAGAVYNNESCTQYIVNQLSFVSLLSDPTISKVESPLLCDLTKYR